MCNKLSIPQRNGIVRGICLIPLSMAITSMVLGTWLCTVIIRNGGLPIDHQIHYEKDIKWNDQDANGMIFHADNDESQHSYIPLDNLSFYLCVLAFVTIFGGFARILVTAIFCNHFCRDKLTNLFYWSWLILGCLAVTIETLVSHDILVTLSHDSALPPYERDFFFRNDAHGFYWLCRFLHVFIWVDVGLHLTTQIALYVIYSKCNVSQNLY